MRFTKDLEIYELKRAFEDRTLPKEEWTHAAHLTVGLYYLVHHSFGVAKNLVRDGIFWLNDKHGTPNTDTSGYHETLTHFWLNEIANFIKANDTETNVVILANTMLEELSDPKLPLKRYNRETLLSVEARRTYVRPDRVKQRGPVSVTQFAFQKA